MSKSKKPKKPEYIGHGELDKASADASEHWIDTVRDASNTPEPPPPGNQLSPESAALSEDWIKRVNFKPPKAPKTRYPSLSPQEARDNEDWIKHVPPLTDADFERSRAFFASKRTKGARDGV